MAKVRNDEGPDGKYAAEREVLSAARIPAFVIDHAIALRPSRRLRQGVDVLMIAISAAGIGVGAFLWGRLEAVQTANAKASALDAGAVLYWTNFGVALIIALFGWLLAASLVAYQSTAFSDRLRASVFVYAFPDPRKAAPGLSMTNLDDLAHVTDADAYMRGVIGQWSKIAFLSAAVLLGVAAYGLSRELGTFSVYTTEGYRALPLLPWESEETGAWADATKVETGCKHIMGKSTKNILVYDVKFADGKTESLGETKALDGAWLDEIEKIDAALIASGARFARWSPRIRNPLHPLCLAAKRREFGDENWERISRLLRIDGT